MNIDFNKLKENDELNIPGDTGGTWRINKFVEFHKKVDVVDPTLLLEYTKRNQLTYDEILLLFWLLSATYSEISAIYIFNDIKNKIGWDKVNSDFIEKYWKDNKQIIQFGSARRYAKSLDWFPILITQFLDKTNCKPYDWMCDTICVNRMNPVESYNWFFKELMSWKFMGKFSVELFLMCFKYFYIDGMIDIDMEEFTTFDWKTYSNETSGLLNLFYKDQEANDFDKSKKLTEETKEFLDVAVDVLKEFVNEQCGEVKSRYLMFMPRICTFRNFCKGMRYAGFHHDRQLRFINLYIKQKPSDSIWEQIFDIRKSIFPNELLGELNGWNDIRPERKKLFLITGNTGAEIIK